MRQVRSLYTWRAGQHVSNDVLNKDMRLFSQNITINRFREHPSDARQPLGLMICRPTFVYCFHCGAGNYDAHKWKPLKCCFWKGVYNWRGDRHMSSLTGTRISVSVTVWNVYADTLLRRPRQPRAIALVTASECLPLSSCSPAGFRWRAYW